MMRRQNVLYLKVAEEIKQGIFSGKYPVGELLPTEAEFEKIFNVSKITIRKAIEILASDELVEKKSGRGTTVLTNTPYNRLSKATTFAQSLHKEKLEFEKKSLSFEVVTLKPEHPAYRYFGSTAMCYRRMYYLDHQPFIYFKYFLPYEFHTATLADFKNEPFYRVLSKRGIAITEFKDSLKSISLDFDIQKFMITPEPHGLKRTRVSVTKENRVVEYSEAIYNTALHPYVVEYEV
jgi:DNA-binding GntR family transcriptional regulator